MAKEKDCEGYIHCGFVDWRKDKVNSESVPLPKNGDCGITFYPCPRLSKDNPIKLTEYGPVFEEEFKVGMTPRRSKGIHR